MRCRIIQLVLILGVVLGLVLPKTSAAMAQLGLIESRTVLICTGFGLQTITLQEDGQPADQNASEHDAPCTLVHALDRVALAETPVWIALSRAYRPTQLSHLWNATYLPATHLARAPPRV